MIKTTFITACMSVAMATNASATTYTYEVFDLPGQNVGSEFLQISLLTRSRGVRGINDVGEVAGTYYDGATPTGYVTFIRMPDGTFHLPGFGAELRRADVADLNELGEIVGTALACNGGTCDRRQGFLGQGDAAPILFDVPFVPATDSVPYTTAGGINEAGRIVGAYSDDPGSLYSWHGFAREANGEFQKIDVTDHGGTQLLGINDLNAMVGIKFEDGIGSAFVRDADGGVDFFETVIGPGPNVGANSVLTYAYGINNIGQISGSYYDDGVRGYVRNPDGQVSYIDVPGVVGNTYVFGINNLGQVTGTIFDPSGSSARGFIATPVSAVPLQGSMASLVTSLVAAGGLFSRRRRVFK